MDLLFDLLTLPFEILGAGQECFCTCFGILAVGACCVVGAFLILFAGVI
jgi:hypothetical protein